MHGWIETQSNNCSNLKRFDAVGSCAQEEQHDHKTAHISKSSQGIWPPKRSSQHSAPWNPHCTCLIFFPGAQMVHEVRLRHSCGICQRRHLHKLDRLAEYARGDTFINWIGLDRLGMSWFGRLRFLKITRTKEENTGQQGWCLSLAVFVFGDFTIFTVLVLAVSETALPFLVSNKAKDSKNCEGTWRDHFLWFAIHGGFTSLKPYAPIPGL